MLTETVEPLYASIVVESELTWENKATADSLSQSQMAYKTIKKYKSGQWTLLFLSELHIILRFVCTDDSRVGNFETM